MTSQRGYGPAVVTPHILATQAGMKVMAQGGNAADAMVAANSVLGVVAPETCGIGGDLFALVHRPGMDAPDALNASGRAGSGVDPESLVAQGHQQMPPFDPQSVTVPGCVDGWDMLLARYGSLPLAEILQPSLRLAREGFPASTELTRALAAQQQTLAPQSAAEGLYPGGKPPAVGDRLFRPGLFRTLSAIAQDGKPAFYRGAVAAAISEATGGVITPTDLAGCQGEWVDPISTNVFGLTGWTVPPNSQGYLTLAAARAFELLDPPLDPESAESWHLAIEAYRVMAYDRDEVLSDPVIAPQSAKELVDEGRIKARASLIDPHHASQRVAPAPLPSGTAYLCAVDAAGMGVSFIQSNFMGIGSRIGAAEAGFFLHNRGAGFDLRPGHPNRLAPGRRPLHTLSPSLWTRGNNLAAVLGTRGGDYQPQLLLQMAIRLFSAGVEPGAAQSRARWMIDAFAAPHPTVAVEAHTPPAIVAGLRERGHRVEVREEVQHGWGPVSVITVDERDLRTAAADPRTDTAAAAVA
ncbi:MAG TPA: gamma-glutamyltransferase family protein [Acidimicrobiia bacterium]|nr:gamma-glutamyltransferase family protein [Acidimicrobiia bacterium]